MYTYIHIYIGKNVGGLRKKNVIRVIKKTKTLAEKITKVLTSIKPTNRKKVLNLCSVKKKKEKKKTQTNMNFTAIKPNNNDDDDTNNEINK